MEQSGDKNQRKKKVYEGRTFRVPFPLEKNQGNLTINSNSPSKLSKEQIINQAFKFHSQGNISEAAKPALNSISCLLAFFIFQLYAM